ncbi:hypothetical protein DH2020_038010 [Rehmannia glutinosa]|uniref:Retrotransposon Copia-like N-terminal domain-containing protein n=1 Tax=Rehmannia glutinosa TaxID=99300 RepID=A0ABR0UZZ4_REHGL
MTDLTAIVAEQTQVVQPQGQLITVKLNDTNFLVWKQQIFAAAKGYGLEGFLTGKHTIPGEFITSDSGKKEINPAYTTWMRQDQLLASWLLSSLSENILITTVGLSSSKEIWESLETSFASQSRAKIMQYRLQLQTLKKGNLPMRDYLNKVKVCCDTLAAAGQKVSEEDQMLHILSGLGNDYDSVMVSITSRVEPCSLREVYALLLSFEARLENAESSQINMDGSTINANFAAQTYVPRRGGGNQFFRGRGFVQQPQGNRGSRNNIRSGYYRGRDTPSQILSIPNAQDFVRPQPSTTNTDCDSPTVATPSSSSSNSHGTQHGQDVLIILANLTKRRLFGKGLMWYRGLARVDQLDLPSFRKFRAVARS